MTIFLRASEKWTVCGIQFFFGSPFGKTFLPIAQTKFRGEFERVDNFPHEIGLRTENCIVLKNQFQVVNNACNRWSLTSKRAQYIEFSQQIVLELNQKMLTQSLNLCIFDFHNPVNLCIFPLVSLSAKSGLSKLAIISSQEAACSCLFMLSMILFQKDGILL
jgi:hypothetical protein